MFKFIRFSNFAMLMFLGLFVFSCSCVSTSNHNKEKSSNIQEETIFENFKPSAVKVSVGINLRLKNKVTSEIDGKTEFIKAGGSGTIIQHNESGSLILTAAHVCDKSPTSFEEVTSVFKNYNPLIHSVQANRKYVIFDLYHQPHVAVIVSISKITDICILLASTIDSKAVKISDHDLRDSEKVYSVNYPCGIWQLGFNPSFQGTFIGVLATSNGVSSAFSMPAFFGSSGGGIINANGELVSMIHSVFTSFHQLSVGVTLKDIKDSLSAAEYIITRRDTNGELIIKKFLEIEEERFKNLSD